MVIFLGLFAESLLMLQMVMGLGLTYSHCLLTFPYAGFLTMGLGILIIKLADD